MGDPSIHSIILLLLFFSFCPFLQSLLDGETGTEKGNRGYRWLTDCTSPSHHSLQCNISLLSSSTVFSFSIRQFAFSSHHNSSSSIFSIYSAPSQGGSSSFAVFFPSSIHPPHTNSSLFNSHPNSLHSPPPPFLLPLRGAQTYPHFRQQLQDNNRQIY